MRVDFIGEIIRERRKSLRVNQEEVAELAEVGLATLSKIERGDYNPSIQTILKIADVLGLELTLGVKK